MDESTLFYRQLPSRTMTLKGETCIGGKHTKDRTCVAFMVTTNGNENLPLLVMGKSTKPRCFKGGCLPTGIIYCSNTKARPMTKLFEEYIHLVNRRFAAKNGSVVLVLDN